MEFNNKCYNCIHYVADCVNGGNCTITNQEVSSNDNCDNHILIDSE